METPVPVAGPRLHHRKGDHDPGASRRSGASLQPRSVQPIAPRVSARRRPCRIPGTLDGPGGGPNRARMMMTLHPPDNVWEARLSLPQRPGGASRPLPLLDAQARSSPPCSVRAGARKDRRLEAHRRRTRPVPGVDREQPGTGTARERNAPHLFACACPHHRQAGSMNPRVSGSA